MKLLLDENLFRRIIPLIESYFPDSKQVAVLGLERASDYEIWEYARNNNFVIVTHDSDFYDLSLLKGSPPQIIWLKIANTSNQGIANLLIDNEKKIYSLLEAKEKCIEIYG